MSTARPTGAAAVISLAEATPDDPPLTGAEFEGSARHVRTLWEDLRALPGPFWVLFTGTFINRVGLFVYPFLTFIMTRRGFTDADLGMALGGYGLGALLASAWGGWAADRFGRKGCIVLGCALNGFAVICLGWAGSLPWLCSMTCLAGFANAFSQPAMSALVADVVTEPQRLRAFAAYRLAINAGFCCGMALGGWLVTSHPWLLFWGDGITTWIFGILAAWLLPRSVGKVAGSRSSWISAFREMRLWPAFYPLLIMEVCLTLIWAQFSTTFARHMENQGVRLDIPDWGIHWGPEQAYSAILGLNGAIIVLMELALTRWTQRFSMMRMLICGLFLQGLGVFGYAVPWGVWWLAGCMGVFTLGEMIFSPVHSAFIAKLTPGDIRGRTQGIIQSGQHSMRIAAPSIGFWALHQGPWVLWGGCFAISLLGVGCAWRAARGMK